MSPFCHFDRSGEIFVYGSRSLDFAHGKRIEVSKDPISKISLLLPTYTITIMSGFNRNDKRDDNNTSIYEEQRTKYEEPVSTKGPMKTLPENILCIFDNIIFDLDSTLVTIEGIDELARLKGVQDIIAPMTQLAMNGQLSIEEAFIKRLEIISPSLEDVSSLTELYLTNLTNGAKELIDWLQNQGKRVFIISGGYDPAVTDVAKALGIPRDQVFANRLLFSPDGEYAGLKKTDWLWKPDGKTKIVAEITTRFPGKTIMVGDGISDLEAAHMTDRFVCFAGVAQRQNVIEQTEYVIYENDLTSLDRYLF